jgi:hypothetical protein
MFPFVVFLVAIVSSALLQFTDSDYLLVSSAFKQIEENKAKNTCGSDEYIIVNNLCALKCKDKSKW